MPPRRLFPTICRYCCPAVTGHPPLAPLGLGCPCGFYFFHMWRALCPLTPVCKQQAPKLCNGTELGAPAHQVGVRCAVSQAWCAPLHSRRARHSRRLLLLRTSLASSVTTSGDQCGPACWRPLAGIPTCRSLHAVVLYNIRCLGLYWLQQFAAQGSHLGHPSLLEA